MADTDRCDLIEAWAREALPEAVDDLPEDFDVRVSSASGDNAYSLVVEIPQGAGAQQLANSIQSVVASLVESDPTLGDRFVEASVTSAGVELVGSGDAGAQSKWELELAVPEEDDDESEDDAGDDADTSDEADADDTDDESDDEGDESGEGDDSGEEDESDTGDDHESDEDGDDDPEDGDDKSSDADSDDSDEDKDSERSSS